MTEPPTPPRMRDLPQGRRPRERLLREGPAALGTDDLLAILLRTGVPGCNVRDLARALAARLPGLRKYLTYDPPALLALVRQDPALKGIGPDKLATVLAALELGVRNCCAPDDADRARPVATAEEAYRRFAPHALRHPREAFWALYLDRRRRSILPEPELLTLGTGSRTLIDPQTLYRRAVVFDAHALLVAHNHPSGDPAPSQADLETTRALVAAGKTLAIPLLDHLVLGSPNRTPPYVSLRADGRCEF